MDPVAYHSRTGTVLLVVPEQRTVSDERKVDHRLFRCSIAAETVPVP